MSNPKKQAPQCAHPADELKVWRPNDGRFYEDGVLVRVIDGAKLPTLFLCPACGITLQAGSEQLKRAVKRDLEALEQ